MFPKTSAKGKKGGKCKQVRQTMGMENGNKTKATHKAMKRLEVPTYIKQKCLKEKTKKEIFEDIMAENFPLLKKIKDHR